MRFGVLGPLQVAAGERDERDVILTPRLRALLAVLLWRAGQPTSAGELAELVWDGAPPGGAREAVRALVLRLRRQLDERAAARVVTRAPGYAIEVSAGELDAARLETLTRQAGTAAGGGRWAQAEQAAAEALGLWRGTPLADVASQLLRDQWVPHLEQLHVQALEWRIEADLHVGGHAQLIPELQDLTARHPLREHFHGQLMLALYRSGRQGEALAAYRRARAMLVADLGVEPGPGLQGLHQQMLTSDPALATPRQRMLTTGPALAIRRPARPGEAEPARVTPRELPPAVPGFTGRAAELAALTGSLDRCGARGPGTVVISAIGGTAGVGKTALAVHWAHRQASRFPDGQLFVNLRGYDPAGAPLQAAAVIRRFLEALAVPPKRIPSDLDAQVGLYRSLLAGKQMLIVLDNARDSSQVRPLLPGAGGCLVLVTSRSRLTDLVAVDGAVPVPVGPLTQAESRELLARRLGAGRIAGRPEAADELIELCARLPLALNIASARPAASLEALLGDLRDERRRLDMLSAGPGAGDIRAVLSWSFGALRPPAARLLCLLTLHPGPGIGLPAAATLAARTADDTHDALRELLDAHLLTEHAHRRYSMHDLLRAYATEQSGHHVSSGDQDQATSRMLDYYLHTAHAAARVINPALGPLPLLRAAARSNCAEVRRP